MIKRLALAAGFVFSLTAIANVGLAAAPTPGPAADLAPPPVVTPAPPIDAAALYKKSCKKCHGIDGKGQTKFAKKIRSKGGEVPDFTKKSDDTVEEFMKVISDGVKDTKMKGYSERLSADEINALAEFAKAFAGG